ncbi:MAG: serine/threonine protein kinase [Candidatus Bathyarchaeota archaeon]|nr:serine/threonine protein kinase [Candidatus Bathyarchaeota archaeon]
MKTTLTITIEKLSEEPYASIICYPKTSKTELKKRLKELQKLGMESLEFSGEKEAFSVPVLGKGCVGIVTIAYRNGEKVALKIRRVDADRSRMQQEAKMLKKANSVHVGPRLLGVSKNFLLMQFIDGDLLPKWLNKQIGKAVVRKVLREVLEQCWRLDIVGLDHGELSHAPKHIIIDKKSKPFIVDFETASLNRKSSNVTSICQFLFISGVVAEKVAEKLGGKDKKAIIEALRRYKSDRTRENFETVLEACGL